MIDWSDYPPLKSASAKISESASQSTATATVSSTASKSTSETTSATTFATPSKSPPSATLLRVFQNNQQQQRSQLQVIQINKNKIWNNYWLQATLKRIVPSSNTQTKPSIVTAYSTPESSDVFPSSNIQSEHSLPATLTGSPFNNNIDPNYKTPWIAIMVLFLSIANKQRNSNNAINGDCEK